MIVWGSLRNTMANVGSVLIKRLSVVTLQEQPDTGSEILKLGSGLRLNVSKSTRSIGDHRLVQDLRLALDLP